jgi:deazaflavin-dependent oxidoreductase (nitroreductase family)
MKEESVNPIKAHLDLYRADPDKGHDWNPYGKMTQALLLTTVGRKTGKKRTIPLIYKKVGANFVLIGSKGGADQHPLWYRNLVEHPEVEIQVRHDHYRATARTAGGEERAMLWRKMAEVLPQYDEYQERTSREIPVIVLEPHGGA